MKEKKIIHISKNSKNLNKYNKLHEKYDKNITISNDKRIKQQKIGSILNK